MEAAGLVNVYVCRECGGHTVTKNRDTGTTPFGISCRAKPGCTGAALSSFYRVSQKLTPAWLWIKPTPEELTAFLASYADKGEHVAAAIRRHVEMGGLLEVEAQAARDDVGKLLAFGIDLASGPSVSVATCSCGWRGESLEALRVHVADQHEPLKDQRAKR